MGQMGRHGPGHRGGGRRRLRALVKEALSRPAPARQAQRAAKIQTGSARWLYNRAQHVEGFVAAHITAPAALSDGTDEHAKALLHSYYEFLTHHVAQLPHQPTFSILLPIYKPDPSHVQEALNSVAIQTYGAWEVCITDDDSNSPEVTRILNRFSDKHPGRVHIQVNSENQHISATSNRCLAAASGDYVALLDQDDRLYPNALAEIVRTINRVTMERGNLPEILYSDERVVDEKGEYLAGAFHKPEWSPFLYLGVNYTNHLSVYRRELLERIGGFRLGFEGAQDHDLMLRATETASTTAISVPLPLYQWRAHPQSTAGASDSKPYAWAAGIRAVEEACARRGRPAKVTIDQRTGHYRLSFELPRQLPLVSIVIPNLNSPKLIRNCIQSILDRSSYPNIEVVIVDNGSSDPHTIGYYETLRSSGLRFQLISKPGYFNFARLNNTGVAAAHGEFIVLLNSDTEVSSGNWIEEMLMYAQFDEVAAVGGKLVYPDGTIQHGGVVMAGIRIADHVGWHTDPDDHVYIDIVNTVHESSAVTAAALMIRRDVYVRLGGFDELNVPNGYGDVDLCLRLGEMGMTNVYTPYACLIHAESATRARNIEVAEVQYMRKRWGWQLVNDPYLNPNLERSGLFTPDLSIVGADIGAKHFRRLLGAGEATWI